MANLGGRSSAQRFVTRPGGVSPASRIAGSPIYIELTRSRQPAPRAHPEVVLPSPLMITCRGSRPALVDALHRSPVRSPSLERGLRPSVSLTFCKPAPSARRREDALAYVRALV